MSAHLYQFPISRDLAAARQVIARPTEFPTDVLDAALTVMDWQGTDEDRAKIAHLPQPSLITGRTEAQLSEARRIAIMAAEGEPLSLPVLVTAQEVLETHGVAEDAPALVQIECAAMLKRMQARKPANPRRGTIREGLRDMALLLGFGAVVLVVVYVGGGGL